MQVSSDNTRAYLFLTITTLCFGMNANFGKLAVGEVSPMLIVMLRWIGTVTLLLVFAHKNFIRDWPMLKSHWPFLILMGMLGLTAFNGLFYIAAHTTTALNIGIIQGSIPIFVLTGTVWLYQSKVRLLQVVGILVTMIGVIIVTSNGDPDRLLTLSFKQGDVLMILACILYSGYSVGLRRCPQVDHISLFTIFAIGALIASFPLAAAEIYTGNLQWPTTKGWAIIGLITLFPSFIAHLIYIKGVAIIGPGRAGIFFNLVPVFAALIAVVFLNEIFAAFHGAALLLVLGGIGLSEWSKSREPDMQSSKARP